ncbi:MAG TPA: tetratricopeptide repeat protein [Burkholderiaceae bacterium]|nr:tetratricopeptide repeat protein [Burkholderiaceae bacterium]
MTTTSTTTPPGESTTTATTTYTLRRVQAMLGLSRTVVSGLIAAGFVKPTRGPRNEHRFTFQDLMLLRTAYALQASKIPPRKILRSLAQLKATLPQTLPLTGLRITAVGTDVAVRDRNGHWAADSGQLLMDFEVAPARDDQDDERSGGARVAFLDHAAERRAAVDHDDADTWFARAETLEASNPRGAEQAYKEALARRADFTDAYLNLGALLSESGRADEAVELYEYALALCPPSALIYYNRAVALEDGQRLPEAIASYERSLALDPALADAHYNIGRLQELLGDARGALRHFSAYRRLQR